LKKVFIGVGHGGADPGAAAHDKTKEKDLNLSIAKACGAYLERHGVQVRFSRARDEDDPVAQEVAECNAYAPDLAVDIHNNAGGGDGAEAFYSRVGGAGKILAVNILAEIAKLGQRSRGAKTRTNSAGHDYYAFIRETHAPAVIVECAFVDSPDLAIIDTEAERIKMGEAIACGILLTLGIDDKPSPSPTEPSKLYRVQVGAYKDKRRAEAEVARLTRLGIKAAITTT
jgi:N-acetylmuramoyl-L-alanine amidase